MSGKAPTVRDVARAAGVSIAVVSYAFNRPDRVASATRERVLAAAAALGYPGPHPAARALRLGRHGAVALVGLSSVEALLADPAAVLVARGLARVCDRAGLALLLAGGPNGAADGAVVLGDARSWDGGGPTVAVGGPAPEGVPCVRACLGEGAAAAARHLAGLGHARLAIIGLPGTGERLEGAREGWGAAGALVSYEAAGPARADGEVAARGALEPVHAPPLCWRSPTGSPGAPSTPPVGSASRSRGRSRSLGSTTWPARRRPTSRACSCPTSQWASWPGAAGRPDGR